MMRWLRIKYLRFCLWIAEKYPAFKPRHPDGTAPKPQNTVIFRMGDAVDNSKFVFAKLTSDGAEGVWYSSPRAKGLFCKVVDENLYKATKFAIERNVLGYSFNYNKTYKFLWSYISLAPERYISADRRAQENFNKITLARKGRTDVLKIFVEQTLIKPDFQSNSFGILTLIHTMRWVAHPDEDRLMTHYNLMLRSLGESGELKYVEYGYEMTPKAITTLAQYEEDDRRHDDNQRQQSRLGWLTAMLFIIASVQAGITVWQELHPDPVAVQVENMDWQVRKPPRLACMDT